MTSLRPMTADEFARFRPELLEGYAAERARNLGTMLEAEREVAERQTAQLLPDGVGTKNHHLWIVTEDAGERVGVLWAFVDPERRRAFIYDIAIDEAHRGKGHGRRTLELLEEFVRPLGVTRISLNVFADNDVAIALYQKQGYRTTNLNMTKHLEPPA
jgi:ribosomal protein S18 acetylase RimI-like enzyme